MTANYDGLTRNIWTGTWSPDGNFPIVLDTEVRGTLQSISGDPGDRLTDVTGQRLTEGMLVYLKNGYTSGLIVRTGDTYYKYLLLTGQGRDPITGEMPNAEANWTKIELSGGSGYSGISGYSGVDGISGYSGVGLSGYSGETGTSGYSGVDGLSGYSGGTGVSGYSGQFGFSGYSGEPFSGDYISTITAGTGVIVTNGTGTGANTTVAIGQPVAITDTVTFGNVNIGTSGYLKFADDAALAALHGATFPYQQISAASRFYTNADAALGYATNDMKPGDFYYDDVGQSIYICIDTGLGYYDFLDLTQRA